MFIQMKNIWYYNVYMHKLKLSTLEREGYTTQYNYD